MFLLFLTQLCLLKYINAEHYIVREFINTELSTSQRFDTGVCRAYRNSYSDSSYMDECQGSGLDSYIITKKYDSLDCSGPYFIVDNIVNNEIEANSLKVEYEVHCNGNSQEWNRLFFYDVNSCDTPIINDAHCVGTAISSNNFCFVDTYQTWQVNFQNNIYSAIFYDKPTKYNKDEDKYCKSSDEQEENSCSADFGIEGTACVPRDSPIYNILVGDNFMGEDYLYIELTSANTNNNNNNLEPNLAQIEDMLEKGAFLNQRSHDGSLEYSSNYINIQPGDSNDGNPSQGQQGIDSDSSDTPEEPRERPLVYGGPRYESQPEMSSQDSDDDDDDDDDEEDDEQGNGNGNGNAYGKGSKGKSS